jgi:hypothetical protein
MTIFGGHLIFMNISSYYYYYYYYVFLFYIGGIGIFPPTSVFFLKHFFEVNLGVTVFHEGYSMLCFLIDETLANFIKTKHLAKEEKKPKKRTQVQAKRTKTQRESQRAKGTNYVLKQH